MPDTTIVPVSPTSPAREQTAQQRLESLIAVGLGKASSSDSADLQSSGGDAQSSEVAASIAGTPDGAMMAELTKQFADENRVEECRKLVERLMAEQANGKGVPKFPKTRLRHQHMIAYMLVNPFASVNDMAAYFGVTRMTLNRIMKSDTFKALVLQHRINLETDFVKEIFTDLQETLSLSLEVVQENVIQNRNGDFALNVAKEAGKLLGMGQAAKGNGTVIQNNINVVTADMLTAAKAARQGALNANALPALLPAS